MLAYAKLMPYMDTGNHFSHREKVLIFRTGYSYLPTWHW